MRMWLVRDKDGYFLWSLKPVKDKSGYWAFAKGPIKGDVMTLRRMRPPRLPIGGICEVRLEVVRKGKR